MQISISTTDTAKAGCRSFFGKLIGTVFFGLFLAAGSAFLVMLIGEVAHDLDTWRWIATPCTIVSSEVVDSGNSDQPFQASVQFRYVIVGKQYLGTRISRRTSTFSDVGKAQRRVSPYEPNREATCYVDPTDPSRAVLERSMPWMGLMVLLPLVFIVVGGGGIYMVWRPRRAPVEDRETAPSISQQARSKTGKKVLLAGGLIFVVIGGSLFIAIFILPMIRLVRATSWPEVPCTVISSTVRSQSSDDGATYSVDILYEYEFSGRTWRSNRYNFLDVSSSGYANKKEIVDRHPPGANRICWVNPGDPTDAVLDRAFHAYYLLGLLPLIFVLAGGALVAVSQKMTPKSRGSTAPPMIAEPIGDGPVELKTSASPAAKLFAFIFITLFWNGIVSVFVWQVIASWRTGQPNWMLTIFMIPFVLIGLGLAIGIVYSALALANPRPKLRLSPPRPRLGDDLRIEWRFAGRSSRIHKLSIFVEGREEATYRRGTDTLTDTEVFATIRLVDSVNNWEIAKGIAEISFPEDTMHSFTAVRNKIVWSIKVKGEVRRWPDVDEEFPLTILPLRPRTAG
ncbi:MAG: DUF3592 domain-containing protein [Thermoanaerobaculales bacterium]